MNITPEQIEPLKAVIVASYERTTMSALALNEQEKRERVAQFEQMRVIDGKKYMKIALKNGSVWGFIVKQADNKFKAGDILKAASWSSPAKNFARGNIFSTLDHFHWTGA